MEIWLDTIDCKTIEEGVKARVIAGVTTNPSILSKSRDVSQTLQEILALQPGPVAVQVTSSDPDKMVEEGLRLFEFSSRLIVKVPITRQGLQAIAQLKQQGIPIMGTTILSSHQALLASIAQVDYMAPYLSHMEDSTILTTIVALLKASQSKSKLLVASLRSVDQILFCASQGVSAITIKPDLYKELVSDQPAVESFIQTFKQDWSKTEEKLSNLSCSSSSFCQKD